MVSRLSLTKRVLRVRADTTTTDVSGTSVAMTFLGCGNSSDNERSTQRISILVEPDFSVETEPAGEEKAFSCRTSTDTSRLSNYKKLSKSPNAHLYVLTSSRNLR